MSIEVPGFEVPDIGDSIATLLERDWDPANTENEVPDIDFINDIKRVRFQDEDRVIVTNLQEFDYPAALQYQWQNISYTWTVNAFTGVSRARGQMLKEEIKRILLKNRINPLDDIVDLRANSWLWIRRFSDNVARWRLAYRWSLDGEIKLRYQKIRT